MTVAYGAIGTGASGTTSCTPSYPTGISGSTSKLYCVITGRSATESNVPTMPAGWTQVGTFVGGTGTYGVDTGTRRVTIFKKDVVTGLESGTVTVSLSGDTTNTLRSSIVRVEVGGGNDTSEQFLSGADTTNGTGYSATASSTGLFTTDDLLLIAVAQNIDSGTQSAQSITATGVTFGTRTNRASTAVTNGNDHRHIIDTVPVTTGSGTPQAPTYAYTISASGSGPTVFLILTEVVIPQMCPADPFDHWEDETVPAQVHGGYFQHVEEPLQYNEDILREEDDDTLDHSAFLTGPVVADVIVETMPPAEVVAYDDDLDEVVESTSPVVSLLEDALRQDAPSHDDDDDDQIEQYSGPVGADVVAQDQPPQFEWDYSEDDTGHIVVGHGSQQEDLVSAFIDAALAHDEDADDESIVDSRPVSEDAPQEAAIQNDYSQQDDDDDQVIEGAAPVAADVVAPQDMPPQEAPLDEGYLGLIEFMVLDFAQVEEDPTVPQALPDFQEDALDDWMPESAPVVGDAVIVQMPPAEVVSYEDDLSDDIDATSPPVADSPLALEHSREEDADIDDEFDSSSAIVGANLIILETPSLQNLPELEDADEEWAQTDTAPVVADVIPPASMPPQADWHDDDAEGLSEFIVLDFSQVEEDPSVQQTHIELSDDDDGIDVATMQSGPVGSELQADQSAPEFDEPDEEWTQTDSAPVVADIIPLHDGICLQEQAPYDWDDVDDWVDSQAIGIVGPEIDYFSSNRTYVVAAELRKYDVAAEDRRRLIEAQSRVLTIESQNRDQEL